MMRIALLILFTITTVWTSEAKASCPSAEFCTTQGEAYQKLLTRLTEMKDFYDSLHSGHTHTISSIRHITSGSYYYEGDIVSSTVEAGGFVQYDSANTCATKPDNTGTGQFNAATDGDIRCFQGCQQELAQDVDAWSFSSTGSICASQTFPTDCPSGYSYNITWQVCTPLPPDADGDGVPDSEDEWPTDPTRTKDTDGDGIADEFDAFPSDPYEHADTDNDGIGDSVDSSPNDPTNGADDGNGDESDNTSTGGGNCENRPVSTGDGITSQIAYQTWATRCASEKAVEKLEELTAKVTGDVTNCNTSYTCTGNSAECAKINALRVQICGVSNITVTAAGDSNSNGIPDELENATNYSDTDLIDGLSPSDIITEEDSSGLWDMLDRTGFLGGASCPQMPEISWVGQSTNMSQQLCTIADAIAAFLNIFALFYAATIIGRGE